MRKHFLDNIRWVTVILVLIYHVFFNFNAEGAFGSIGKFTDVQYQDSYLYLVYPWFMALLFLVAGVSSRYSIETKGRREFVRSRNLKLLVPSTIGLLVFQWMLGYFNIKSGGGWDTIPAAVRYPVMVISGTGPLWFIQLLWIFSLIASLLHRVLPAEKLEGKNWLSYLVLATGFLLLWGTSQSQIDNPTAAQGIINLYRPLFYIVPFLMGYYIFSQEKVQQFLSRISPALLVAAVCGAIAYIYGYFGKDYTSPACLQSFWTNIYAWVMILAFLGCFKKWADKTGRFATYMTKSSFGIYIVHMLICTSTCALLKSSGMPIWSIYVLALLATLLLSPVLYEILRRIPIIRWCVLGIKNKK